MKIPWRICSEQDTATKWIKPLLNCLGWDIYDIYEVKEGLKLDLESGQQQFFDCVLYYDNTPYIVMEFKRIGIGTLHNKASSIEKLKRNVMQTKARYAVFTRFSETIVYDARTGQEKAYFDAYDVSSNYYLTNFKALWNLLSNPGLESRI